MSKKAKFLIIGAILITLLIIVVILINKTNIIGETATKLQQADGITVIPTMRDTITTDSSWCGTFQLVWNDMKNDVVKNYDTAEIEKAIQTIEFSLDEKGGEIKSEAGISSSFSPTSIDTKPKTDEPRYFYVDDTFTIFLREKGKSLPYFAGRVEDITKFQ